MNITFKKIKYKNILSTGNVFTEIVLTGSKTTLLWGTNGAGKSTVLDSITFALFGKPFRKITKPQLLNTINQKDLVVEIEFSIGIIEYLIRRGIKPNIFEIYKNDELINQDAASRDYQEYLEQNILKMSYKSFTQIVILGSATYIPFMELTTANRREIIEDLLDIQIFTTMNILLKDKISVSKTSIEENKNKIELVKSKLESAQENREQISKIKTQEVDKIKTKIQENLRNIEQENTLLDSLETSIQELIVTINDKSATKKKHDTYKDLKTELYLKNKVRAQELMFYHDNDNCPTCKQGIEHDFKTNVISEKKQETRELEKAIEKIEEKTDIFSARLSEISEVEDKINKIQLKCGEHRVQIKISKSTLLSCKNDLEEAQKEVKTVDISKIVEYNEQLKNIEIHQEELFSERETLAVAASMLKDGGIKTRVIRQYIPIMNKLINKYLASFELFVDFQLDENFNEVIKSRFRDTFTYASFSEGEKMKINLSILLCWRAISKLRNSVSTNILILDETLDGSMDTEGVGNLIDILHQLNTGDNVFVISHRGSEFGEKFEHNIKFEKVKNFSQISGV